MFHAHQTDRIIIRRRLAENKSAALQQSVEKDFHLGCVARWQKSSAKMAINKQQQREAQAIAKQKEIELKIRRQKLKILLLKEEEEHKKAIDNKCETYEQRVQRLQSRAIRLRNERIEKRKQFVEEQRMKQFREKCDEIRLNHGQNLTLFCDKIRKQQMIEKQIENDYKKIEEEKHLKIWEKQLQEKIERENREKDYKRNLNRRTAQEIKQQILAKENARVQAKKLKIEAIKERLNNMRMAKDEEFEKTRKKMSDLKIKREERRNEFLEFQNRRKSEFEMEQKLDKDFIQSVIQKEKENQGQIHNKKKNESEDIEIYLQYLNELRAEEKEREQTLEKMRAQELQREWSKREIKWKKEELARAQLLESVVQDRENQIGFKQIMNLKAQRNSMHEAQKISVQLETHHENEKIVRESKLKYNKEIQAFLAKQIEENEEQRHSIANNHEFHRESMAENARYSQMLKMNMEIDEKAMAKGKTIHHYPRKSANWCTF